MTMPPDSIDSVVDDINKSLQVYTHEDLSTEELSNLLFDKLVGNGVSSRIIRYTYNNQPFYSVQYYNAGKWYNFNYTDLDMFFQPVWSRTLNPQDIVKTEIVVEGTTPEPQLSTSSQDPDFALTTKTYIASETLYPNTVVNIYDEDGVTKVRPADATDDTKPGTGYVKTYAETGDDVTVYFDGLLPGISLTPGISYFLSTTPGLISPDPPMDVGNVWQKIGVAVDTGNIEFEPEEPITRE